MENEQTMANLAALVTPLPPVPEGEVFTSTQWETLISICEVFVPSITQLSEQHIDDILPANSSSETTLSYLSETVTDEKFKETIRRRFAADIPPSQVKALTFVLSAFNTTIGSLLLTGSTTILQHQPQPVRTQIVCNWSKSYLPPLRAIFRSFENLTKATWLGQSLTYPKILDYPSIPKNIERNATYPYKFIEFNSDPPGEIVHLSADIVIVGSGCGAGVVASELSSLSKLTPKLRIIVLEKGYHYSSEYFPMDGPSGGANLFESGCGLLSDDGTVAFMAGATFGGGGTVNWSASLQPQHFVREEWASKHNLPFFRTNEFQQCLDEVCDKMGVCRMHDDLEKHKIPHSYANRTLLEGARRLGLNVEVVPQNTAGKPHDCGRCGMGCPSATKQGPVNGWFPHAAENGVEFIQGCFAQEILWEERIPSTQKKACGLKAVWTSTDRSVTRQIHITCPRIIVSAGALHSPLLLHRSGFTTSVNHHIGSHLHVHPTVCISATFPERVNPWDGPILTSAVTSLENLDGQGHGPKIEVMFGTTDIIPLWQPWRPQLSLDALKNARANGDADLSAPSLVSAIDYKLRVARFAHSFGLIAIQRDIETGANNRTHVYADPEMPTLVHASYTTSDRDKDCLLTGALTAARIAYIMGAESIDVFSADIPVFQRSKSASQDVNDAAFNLWSDKVKAMGGRNALASATIGSAHQMGTCRMSARREDGVVDPRGKVWGTENVWIADASVFPSASGVNPMVTVMGISLKIARGIVEEIIKGRKEKQSLTEI